MKAKKLSCAASLLATALILSYAESFIPMPVVGIKPGLANAVTILLLYGLGFLPALSVGICRAVISGLLFSSPVGIIYGVCGTLLSLCTMALCEKLGAGTVNTSCAGAVMHGAGQILAACVLMKDIAVLWYFPVLLISGIICGAAVGTVCLMLKKPLSRFIDTAKIKNFGARDVIIPLAALAVFSATLFIKPSGDTVTVSVDGKLYASYPLYEDRTVEISTEYGKNVIKIKNGSVSVVDSDCGGDCLNMRAGKDGGIIICLPNRLVVKTEGKSAADAVAG